MGKMEVKHGTCYPSCNPNDCTKFKELVIEKIEEYNINNKKAHELTIVNKNDAIIKVKREIVNEDRGYPHWSTMCDEIMENISNTLLEKEYKWVDDENNSFLSSICQPNTNEPHSIKIFQSLRRASLAEQKEISGIIKSFFERMGNRNPHTSKEERKDNKRKRNSEFEGDYCDDNGKAKKMKIGKDGEAEEIRKDGEAEGIAEEAKKIKDKDYEDLYNALRSGKSSQSGTQPTSEHNPPYNADLFKYVEGSSGQIILELTRPLIFFIDMDNRGWYFKRKGDKEYTSLLIESNQTAFYCMVPGTNYLVGYYGNLSATEGSGGSGAMRADHVRECDYRWLGNKPLGISLGLAGENCICDLTEGEFESVKDPVDKMKSAIGAAIDNLHKENPGTGPTDSKFVLTNIPWQEHSPIDIDKDIDVKHARSIGIIRTTLTGWMGSEILYLKRFKLKREEEEEVVWRRNLPQIKAKNDSSDVTKISISEMKPIIPKIKCRDKKRDKSKETKSLQVIQKGGGEKGETPGVKRLPAKPDRKDAGAKIYEYMQDQPEECEKLCSKLPLLRKTKRIPATDYANYIIQNDPAVKEGWTAGLKGNGEIWTDQEWCHLIGHGDGGEEHDLNLVSGSKHSNTEQLAIELGHRRAAVSNPSNCTLKVTAYVFKSLLARVIRYKIYYKTSKGIMKIFDHAFDAQSKSFNYHEFLILQTTVRRVMLNADDDLSWYQETVNDKLKKELQRLQAEPQKPQTGSEGLQQVSKEPQKPQMGKAEYEYNKLFVQAISKYMSECVTHTFDRDSLNVVISGKEEIPSKT